MRDKEKSNKKSKYCFGTTTGRPPKYTDTNTLQAAIIDYFENGITTRKVVTGRGKDRKIEEIPAPTITGLVLHLGFCDRASFYDYEKSPLFSHTIKRARTFIEREYEEMLAAGNVIGAIFALKNFGWIDKQQVDVSSDGIEALLHRLHNKPPGASGIPGGRND